PQYKPSPGDGGLCSEFRLSASIGETDVAEDRGIDRSESSFENSKTMSQVVLPHGCRLNAIRRMPTPPRRPRRTSRRKEPRSDWRAFSGARESYLASRVVSAGRADRCRPVLPPGDDQDRVWWRRPPNPLAAGTPSGRYSIRPVLHQGRGRLGAEVLFEA